MGKLAWIQRSHSSPLSPLLRRTQSFSITTDLYTKSLNLKWVTLFAQKYPTENEKFLFSYIEHVPDLNKATMTETKGTKEQATQTWNIRKVLENSIPVPTTDIDDSDDSLPEKTQTKKGKANNQRR
ncbi:hypothetical protein AVEN_151404-1 [Araneus ventricosus]|uniref:Uncharacterized protein n=1 Tax=Araneus ventricosus TaxID=182803 RepID=A0A4Y2C934_ARAVE|nr:hypothetical protein AVEN_151404-1 [Araneus ventricosus]